MSFKQAVRDHTNSYFIGFSVGTVATAGAAALYKDAAQLAGLCGVGAFGFNHLARRRIKAQGGTLKKPAFWAGALTPVIAVAALAFRFGAAAFSVAPSQPPPQAAPVTFTGEGTCQGVSATVPANLADKLHIDMPGCTLVRGAR